VSKLEVYKRTQGKYTRTITFVSVMLIGVLGAAILSGKLRSYDVTATPYVRFGVPAGLIVLLGLIMFRVVNRARTADFLIATEGEMKKVSWSSKKDVIGSTKVVIVTTFIMAGILFGVDLLFKILFDWLKS